MTIRYNAPTLSKLEKMVEEAGYVLRYERGTFQSGYCILESRKVVVLNKFLQTEGRINTVIDLLPSLQVDPLALTPESRKVYEETMAGIASSSQNP
ncbi:MAG: hypothetical protein MUE58_00985 [Chitinophagaceae bacterium]|jgi:hypothetical protein|nr:hypothetical protein [Chitinophagaceae bacterium]